MNDQSPFERIVADSVNSIGVPAPSDGALERTISLASQKRQRPRWLAVIKEPPMRRSSSVAVGSPTVRVVAIMVATLLLALMVVAVGIAGARLLTETTIVVDPSGEGTVTTLTAGLEMVGDGGTIVVKPGTYAESLTINEDITLIGDGDRAEIILSGDGTAAPMVSFLDSDAELSNVTFSGDGGSIVISGGSPTLSGLAFEMIGAARTRTDDGVPAVILDDETRAQILLNDFAATSGGIVVRGAAAPLIEGNTFNRGPTLILENVGDETVVRGNEITFASYNGIEATSAGNYLIEGNKVDTDALPALSVLGPGEPSDTTPIIRRNTLGNSDVGVLVAGANPTIIENLFWGNGYDLELLRSDSLVQGNLLGTGNIAVGDRKRPDESFGSYAPTIVDNTVYVNGFPPVAFRIGRDTSPPIRGNAICADVGFEEAVLTNDGADPTFEDNDMYTPVDTCPTGNLDKLIYGVDQRQQVFDEFFGVSE